MADQCLGRLEGNGVHNPSAALRGCQSIRWSTCKKDPVGVNTSVLGTGCQEHATPHNMATCHPVFGWVGCTSGSEAPEHGPSTVLPYPWDTSRQNYSRRYHQGPVPTSVCAVSVITKKTMAIWGSKHQGIHFQLVTASFWAQSFMHDVSRCVTERLFESSQLGLIIYPMTNPFSTLIVRLTRHLVQPADVSWRPKRRWTWSRNFSWPIRHWSSVNAKLILTLNSWTINTSCVGTTNGLVSLVHEWHMNHIEKLQGNKLDKLHSSAGREQMMCVQDDSININ